MALAILDHLLLLARKFAHQLLFLLLELRHFVDEHVLLIGELLVFLDLPDLGSRFEHPFVLGVEGPLCLARFWHVFILLIN